MQVFLRFSCLWFLWLVTTPCWAQSNDAALRKVVEQLLSGSAAERQSIWAANKALISDDLALALLAEAEQAMLRQDFPRSLLAQQCAKEIGVQLKNPVLIARILSLLGDIQHTQGDYRSAVQSHLESLKLLEAENFTPGLLGVLNNLGTIYIELGDYEAAIASFQRSLRVLGTVRNVNTVKVLTNLGSAYIAQGDYTKALLSLNQSIELSKSLHDPVRQAIGLNSLARLYLDQGDERQVEACYQQALELRKNTRPDAALADLLANYGIWLARRGRYEEAHSLYQQALGIIPKADKTRQARFRQNIGDLYRRQKQYEPAQQSYEAALNLREAINSKEGMSYTLHGLSLLMAEQKQFEQALNYLARALNLAREVGNPDLLWREYDNAGKLYEMVKKPQEARRAFEEAINIIEALRTQIVGGEQQQEQFFESRLSPYHSVIKLMLAEQNVAEALAYAERAKARVLLDVLRSGRANVAKALTPAEQEKEKALQDEIISLNTQLYRANLRKQPDAANITALNTRLQKARTEQEALQTALYAAHPELKVQRGQTPKFDLVQVGNALLDTQTALLEYLVLENKTYLFVLTRSTTKTPDLKLYEVGAERDQLNRTVEEFRRQLAQHEMTFAPTATQLYTQLVKPAIAQLKGKTKLIIVRDAGLWELPFQALRNEKGRFLLEDYAISYAPSLMALTEMRKVQRSRLPAAPTLIAFGNPAFGSHTAESPRTSFVPLPSSETEVQQLGKLYGTSQSKIYVGAEAREERLKAEAGTAHVLHLATHGILNNAAPLYSQIVLAQPNEKSKEDGLLEAWEVMKLDLGAQIVVLSACETGRGRISAGEGVIGLTWAFFVAGAPTTVVSQWKVDAECTSELMQEFHRCLQSGNRVTKTEALRAAELKLLATPKYRHPFYWASFSLIGEGQ